MALTPQEEQNLKTRNDLLFKGVYANKAATSVDKVFFEEEFDLKAPILPSQILEQEALIPDIAAEVPGVVELVTDKVLIPVGGSDFAFFHPDLVGSLPFNFGDGTSYIQTLKKSDDSIIPFGQNNWVFIAASGVVYFMDGLPAGVSAGSPPKLTTFKYIGTTGTGSETSVSQNVIAMGGTGGVGVVDAPWSINGNDILPPLAGAEVGDATHLVTHISGKEFEIGGVVGDPDNLYLAHPDNFNATDYGFFQYDIANGSHTQVNAKAGATIIASISNNIKLQVEDGANAGVSMSQSSPDIVSIGAFPVSSTGAKLSVKGIGNTDSTLGFTVSSLDATLLFNITDGGIVNSELGYWLDEKLFLHYGADITDDNVFAGGSGNATLTGVNNFGGGDNALAALTIGFSNIAIGTNAASLLTLENDYVSIGQDASASASVGKRVVAIGTTAGQYAQGFDAVYIGANSTMSNLFTGDENVLIGGRLFDTINTLTTARRNVYIGSGANAGKLSTGSQNVVIGYKCAEQLGTGSNNLFFGNEITVPAGVNNAIAIGSFAEVTADDQIVLGRIAAAQIMYIGGVDSIITANINDVRGIALPSIRSGVITDAAIMGSIFRFDTGAGSGTGKGGIHQWRVAPATSTSNVTNPHIAAMELDSEMNLAIYSGGIDPAGVVDGAQIWVKDIAVGNAAIHSRSENGGIIKWYQQADIVALTDNSGGTANDVIQALTDPADTPATADALRDDLVLNLIPELRNNIADLTAKYNALRTFHQNNGQMA